MLSHIFDKISFWSLSLTIMLLPMFFLPGLGISPEVAKGALLVFGLAIAVIAWAAARFSDGKISIPKSYVWIAVFFVLLSTFLSAILSSGKKCFFFGTMFDIGSFWFIFTAFVLMFFSAIIINDVKKFKFVLWGSIFSFGLVLVFQFLRIALFRGENPIDLSFGGLTLSRTANLIGSWSSLGIVSSLFAFISLFLIEFFNFEKKWIKYFLGLISFLSLFVVVLVNIPLVWMMLGGFSIIIFAYKVAISGKKEEHKRELPVVSFVFVLLALLFLMSGRFIGNILPQALNLYDVEVGPSFVTTIKTTIETLKVDPVFGVGPNRFLESWAMHKPGEVNNSIFWDTPFSYASGLIPTFMANTGILGILSWLVLVIYVLVSGTKYLVKNMFEEKNKEIVLVFFVSLYLLLISFFYASGAVIFLLALVFLGIFVGLKNSQRENGNFNLAFLDDPRKSLFSILFLFFIVLATAGITFKYVEKFASAFSFASVSRATDVDKAINRIERAVLLNPNDFYFRTYSQVHLLKISSLVNKQESLTEEEQTALRTSFEKTISGANSAIAYNKNNYLNFVALGNIYSAVAPLGIESSYENAIEAYKKASELNPKNPGIKREIAQAYFLLKNYQEADTFAKEAITLKPNFLEGYILLARINEDRGDKNEAIKNAEIALSLSPGQKEIVDYLNKLKGVSSASAQTNTEVETNTETSPEANPVTE